MTYDDILNARRQAQETIRLADIAARQAASLVAGRLQSAACFIDDLRKLKKELQNFNSVTGKWADK